METLILDLKQEFFQEIWVGRSALEKFFQANLLNQFSRVVIVIDKVVYNKHHWLNPFIKNFSLLIDEFPEEKKEKETLFKVIDFFWEKKLDRKSLVIAIGGGVLGDLVGFAASIFKRGISYIVCPTTLLAQADAAIGGKTGINYKEAKNILGTFYPAKYVIIDPVFLNTLPERIFREGFGEVIKYAFIKNKELLKIIEEEKFETTIKNNHLMEKILIEAIKTKVEVVKEDPYEKNLRKILNFGHTAGHAFESLSFKTNNPLKHGEAVAWGMIFEGYLSYRVDYLSWKEFSKIREILENFGLLKQSLPKISFEEFYKKILQDKKNVGNEVKFVLLKKLGESVFDVSVNKKIIKKVFEELLTS